MDDAFRFCFFSPGVTAVWWKVGTKGRVPCFGGQVSGCVMYDPVPTGALTSLTSPPSQYLCVLFLLMRAVARAQCYTLAKSPVRLCDAASPNRLNQALTRSFERYIHPNREQEYLSKR